MENLPLSVRKHLSLQICVMKQTTLNLRGRIFDLSTPQVMGIINVTPDSFYEGSRKRGEAALHKRVEEILNEGGTMVDVGGCSTRPGSTIPTPEEEKARLEPILALMMREYPEIPFSVDTFRADIAAWSVECYGAHIINDISGGSGDPAMYPTVARLEVPYILMHMEGGIAQMHQEVDYKPSVEVAVLDFFIRHVAKLRDLGVKDIILDPGYGFSKTRQDNFRLLGRSAEAFQSLELPILTGFSRKRVIWQTLGTSPEEALNGTTVLNTVALVQGTADILRVHDVHEAVEAVKLVQALQNSMGN